MLDNSFFIKKGKGKNFENVSKKNSNFFLNKI